MIKPKKPLLRDEVADLLNRHSRENRSNTPDYLLAHFLMASLDAFERTVNDRDRWYGIKPSPGWDRSIWNGRSKPKGVAPGGRFRK